MMAATCSWSLESVTLTRGGKPILQGVSCQIQPGHLTSLLGCNGAGKTSLLRGLAGLLPVSAGQIHYQEQPVSSISPTRRAREMAWVGQHPDADLPFSVLEYVALGRHPHRDSWVPLRKDEQELLEAALQQVELVPMKHKPLSRLSGGERQRAALARALAQQTPCLLLDEPTNHLDLKHQHALQRLLVQLARQGRTVVQVLHDLELAARYSNVVGLLAHNRLLGWGAAATVLQPEPLRQAYGVALQPQITEEGGLRFIVGALS